jgi:PAS domain S-box-containing protein
MTQRQHTVLIVDDISQDRELYRRYLASDPDVAYTVLEAESGEDGLALCQLQRPDGILLDFCLPDLNGLQFLTRLRDCVGDSYPSIVMISGQGDESIAVKAIKYGAEDYLVKSKITPAGLQLTLKSAIENAELRLALQQTEQALQESERRYRAIVQDQTELICRFLPDGTLTFVNQAYSRYFDSTVETLTGQNFLQFIAEADCETVRQQIAALNRLTPNNPILMQEHAVLKANGEMGWQQWTNRAIFDAQGQIVEFQAVGRDISDRKATELSLQQANERFKLAATAVNCLIYDLNLQNNTVYRSQGLTDLLGYLPEAVDTSVQWWQQQIHPEDWIGMDLEDWKDALEQTNRYCVEYRVRHRDGHYVWVEDRGVVVKDEAGQPIRLVGSTSDISERKQAEVALRESEARLKRLIDLNLVGVEFWDADGTILDANDAFLNLVGYTRADLQAGRVNWRVLTPPEQLVNSDTSIETMRQRTSDTLEKEYIRKDGSRVSVLLGGVMFDDSQERGVSFVVDLTASKQAAAALKQSESLFRGVFESDLIGILFWNTDGQITDANQAFCHLTGYSREELHQGQVSYHTITPPEYHALDAEKFARLQATGQYSPIEKEYICKDGSRIPVLLGCAFLPGSQDQGVAFVLDIREQKRLQQERERLLAEAQEARTSAELANRTKDEFLAVVSHELRSPLNAILGWTKLLRSRQLDSTRVEQALEIVERNTQAQVKLIDDLLDVSRILHGQLRLESAPVHLTPIVDVVVANSQLAAEAKQIKLRSVADVNVGQIMGDLNRLQQIITNLVANAVKFTPTGGQVDVVLERQGNRAVVRVADTGRGISPEFLPYVFERFRQANNSTTRSRDGLGLGLAIVRHLVELHGGTVRAESPGVDQGATFTVTFPLIENCAEPVLAESVEPVGDLSQIKVLVVDDMADTCDYLQFVLGECGAMVTACDSAAAAYEAFQRVAPDILLSDIGMPEEDGYSLLQRIRQLPQGQQVLAIALTAFAKPEDRARALAAGFQEHMTKPVDPNQLINTIVNLLNMSTC